MRGKAYLEQIEILDTLIDNKMLEVEKLRAMATKVTASASDGDRVQATGSQDRMADTVIKIVQLQEEINEDIDKLIDLKGEIIQVIDQVNNPDMIDLLYKRYYQYKSFEQIAADMHYTYRWICKLHGRALQKVENIINRKEGNSNENKSSNT